MGVIDYKFFKTIVNQADKLNTGAITIGSRGEPTMHKKFVEMVEDINTKKNILEIKLNTNGTYLTEKICHALFKNELTQIVISSDHYIKEDYERLRMGSNFEKVVANVDMLFNIRKKFYPNSTTEIRISGIDNDKNLDRKKFKEFWIKRCDHVSASFPMERWNTYENSPHPEIKDPCENLWDRMYVWFDGKVNPCDADYKSYLSYGNAKEFSLKELWNNKMIERNRKIHCANNRHELNPCDRCGATYQ
jgi:radical SAM protein with 4Fe4S-binding SPASM domain